MIDKKYIVYIHIFPNNKKYIGITSTDIDSRWNYGLGYSNQKLMYNAIKKYGWENIKHKILYKNLSQNEACQREIELIQKYQTIDPKRGYNVSIGGEIGFAGTYGFAKRGKIVDKYTIYGDYVESFDSIKNAQIRYPRKGFTIQDGFIYLVRNKYELTQQILKMAQKMFRHIKYKKCLICEKYVVALSSRKYCDNCGKEISRNHRNHWKHIHKFDNVVSKKIN